MRPLLVHHAHGWPGRLRRHALHLRRHAQGALGLQRRGVLRPQLLLHGCVAPGHGAYHGVITRLYGDITFGEAWWALAVPPAAFFAIFRLPALL